MLVSWSRYREIKFAAADAIANLRRFQAAVSATQIEIDRMVARTCLSIKQTREVIAEAERILGEADAVREMEQGRRASAALPVAPPEWALVFMQIDVVAGAKRREPSPRGNSPSPNERPQNQKPPSCGSRAGTKKSPGWQFAGASGEGAVLLGVSNGTPLLWRIAQAACLVRFAFGHVDRRLVAFLPPHAVGRNVAGLELHPRNL